MPSFKDRLVAFLRFTERYTKTDMVYLTTGGFWITVGQAVSSLAALALAIAFANLTPQDTYGTYKYILSAATLLSIFTLPGVGTAFARVASLGTPVSLRILTHTRIRFSLIGAAIALAGSAYYAINHNSELALAFLIIAVTLPVFDTFTLIINYFAGIRRFDLQTKYHALTQAVSIAVLISTLLLTDNVLLIVLAYFIPLSVTRFAIYLATKNSISGAEDTTETQKVIGYGKHLTAMNLLWMVSAQVDKLLIWHFLGPVQVAVYAFALAIPEQLKGPLRGVGDLAFPKFASQTPQQIRAHIPSLLYKLALYGAALLLLSVAYIAAAPFIFELLFPQYMESVIYSQLFAVSLVTGVGSLIASLLAAQEKTKEQYIINTVQPIINIALLALLIPLYGIMGAIIALVTGRFIQLGMFFWSLVTVK